MATKKMKVLVKFGKGLTISKNYQAVKYEIGIEVPCDVGVTEDGKIDARDFRDALEHIEEIVNKELKRRKDKSSGLHALGDDE